MLLLRLKYDQSSDQLAGRIIVGAPRIRHLQPAQLILIPAFALRAVEATVLNRFSFGQTDLILESAIWKCASPLNLNQQRRPRKKEFRFCFCHALQFLQRPFTTDEMQVQPRDSVGADATVAHYSQNVRS